MVKHNKKLISSLVSLIVVGISFCVALACFYSETLGWFASSKDVSATGMTIDLQGPAELDVYFLTEEGERAPDGYDLFSNLNPGDTVTLKIRIDNNDAEKAVSATMWMAAPTSANDTPYIEGAAYHYFGTQIRFTSISASIDGAAASQSLTLIGRDAYLLRLPDSAYDAATVAGDFLPPTSVSSEIDFSGEADREITAPLIIPAGKSAVLEITFEYVDNHKVQNPYMNFGQADNEAKKDLVLSRNLYCKADFVN